MATSANELEARLRGYIRHRVHEPLKASGYRRSGRVWRSAGDGVIRVVDLQRERSGSTIEFTLNVGVAVPGYHWYLFGFFDDTVPDASLAVLSGRVGWAFDPPRDVWFVVSRDVGLERREPLCTLRLSDGSELRQVLRDRVVPALARFSTAQDVLRYIEGHAPKVPFLDATYPRKPAEPLRAVIAWRAVGSPIPAVTVTPVRESTVRVAVGRDLVDEYPELVTALIETATPVADASRVREVIARSPGVFDVVGQRLRPEVMKASYERFLAVRRFGAPPARRTPMWSFPSEAEDLEEVDVEDVSIEEAEDAGDVLVTFSDEVAHEHADLVEQCVERCRTFPGADEVYRQDREVIVISGPSLDRETLRNELLRIVRHAVAGRDAADHEEDD